jgi:hypothetical protein
MRASGKLPAEWPGGQLAPAQRANNKKENFDENDEMDDKKFAAAADAGAGDRGGWVAVPRAGRRCGR